MVRLAAAAALMATLCSGLPALAQDVGGMRLRSPGAVLDQLQSPERAGCRLSQTSVTFGINKAAGPGSLASQGLSTDARAGNGCRPLVSTAVVAGVNLGLGPRSGAAQSITSQAPQGLLATTQVTRGVNLAAGPRSAAQQRLINQVGR
jgi:hypothetical protein